MQETQRQQEMLFLITRTEYLPQKELCSRFHLSDRTIRSEIRCLNDFLRPYGARVLLVRGRGYHLDVQDVEAYSRLPALRRTETESSGYLRSQDRVRQLLIVLMERDTFTDLDTLAEEIYVSRATLQSYLRQCTPLLEEYHLEMISHGASGIRLLGAESDLRRCLFSQILERDHTRYIVRFSPFEKQVFRLIDLEQLINQIRKILEEEKIGFSDYSLKTLTLHAALVIVRTRAGRYLAPFEEPVYPSSLQPAAARLQELLETEYQADLTRPERWYLSEHLVLNCKPPVTQAPDERLVQSIRLFLEQIRSGWGLDLLRDARLMQDLISHLSGIFSSRLSARPHKNPVLHQIRTSFPLAYEVTLTSLYPAFDPADLLREEAGYICLHVAAAMERCYAGDLHALRVLLVCGAGTSSGRLLEARLESIFGSLLQVMRTVGYVEYYRMEPNDLAAVDLVISTVPAAKKGVPVIQSEVFLQREDISSISRMCETLQQPGYRFEDFFSPELFAVLDHPCTKEEVLRILCRKLQKSSYADAGFDQEVLEREKAGSTRTGTQIAIPRGMKAGSPACKTAAALVHDGTSWQDGGPAVRLVLLPVFSPDDPGGMQRLCRFLSWLSAQEGLLQELTDCDGFEPFVEILSARIHPCTQ